MPVARFFFGNPCGHAFLEEVEWPGFSFGFPVARFLSEFQWPGFSFGVPVARDFLSEL